MKTLAPCLAFLSLALGVSAAAAAAEPSAPQAAGPDAATQGRMKAQMYSYIRAVNAGEPGAIVAHYTDDASIEDPVGAALLVGKPAITAFYEKNTGQGLGIDLVGLPVTSRTNQAAMAVKVHARMKTTTPLTLNVIEVFTFAPDGRFTSMKAYWGSEDREPLSQTRPAIGR